MTIVGMRGAFARNHHEIPARLYMRQKLNASGFPESALHEVTHNGVAYPLAYREPETTMLRFRAPRNEHKPSVCPTSALAPHRREIPRLSQAMLLLHIRCRHSFGQVSGKDFTLIPCSMPSQGQALALSLP